MKKGTPVKVRAKVASGYYSEESVQMMTGASIIASPGKPVRKCRIVAHRQLIRIELDPPIEAIVVGKSLRKTGIRHGGNCDTGSGYLTGVESHPVVMVQPIHTPRWLRPYACLEADLEVTDE